jgi:Xaa-Pro aminopeptidase
MSHLSNLIEKLQKSDAQAALVTSEVNQQYLTGFDFSDGYVLVTLKGSYLLTDFRYIEAARATVGDEFEILMPEGGVLKKAAELIRENGVTTLLIEEATLSCLAMERIKAMVGDGVTVKNGASALIDTLRLYKDEGELAAMQKAQNIADAAFAHVLEWLTPNMTEIEVALELEFFMRKNGARSTSFDTIAVSGSASSLPHGVPRNVKLEKGFFTMDFGARVNGYCSDMTRTVVLGKADAEMKKLYNTVLRAQLAALEAAHEGVGCKALDTIARDIIHGEGYVGCFGHSLGHGVGMYIHENPRLSQAAKEDSVLKPGHVVTFEPGIYIEGKYGCRIEDMGAIRADGTLLNFAHSPKEMIELF